MMVFWQYLFWISLLGLSVAYFLYPLFILTLSSILTKNKDYPLEPDEWPEVDIVFAAFNEEAVLREKIASLRSFNYPPEKLKFRIGSDNSTDATNRILKEWAQKDDRFKIQLFKTRQGKSNIINQLIPESKADYLLLTDANILFDGDSLKKLVLKLKSNRKAGAVGAEIIYSKPGKAGISKQENTYLRLENRVKLGESRLWQAAMGLEGSAYLIRRELFPSIPPLFFMEDFFVTMHLFSHHYKVLWEPGAKVYEDVSVSPQEEYRRKVRISIGNFQNLNHYKSLLIKQFWPVGFSFLGHKILRWFSPFFLLLLLISAPQLALTHWVYSLVSGFYMLFIGLGLFGILFSQKNKGGLLKYPGHFIYMNLALLDGFLTYIKGIKTNAWQPTARKQN